MSTPQDHPLAQPEPRRPRDFGIDTALLRRIRLIAFAVLALPLIVLTLLALKFVSLPLTQLWHDNAYQDQKYPTAIERLAPVEFANWFEPYLPHLSRGTDLLQEGKNAEAEKELRESLAAWTNGKDLNKPQHAQCKILNNLAISIERQADDIKDPDRRGDRLFEAEKLLAPCGGGGGGDDSGQGGGGGDEDSGQGGGNGNEDSGTTKKNGERVEKKRRKADEEAGKDPDDRKADKPSDDQGDEQGGGKGDQDGQGKNKTGDPRRDDPSGKGPDEEKPTQGKDPEQQKKEDELEKRNKGADGGDGDETGGPTDQGDKPW